MRILIVYFNQKGRMRKTIEDSIFCFQRYAPASARISYYSYQPGHSINWLVKYIKFDVIVFHSIFMCQRWQMNGDEWNAVISDFEGVGKGALKAVIAQDEQYMTTRIHDFIKRLNIDILFTCASKKTKNIFYPEHQVSLRRIIQVLPGYVDIGTLRDVKRIINSETIPRDIDIGYRADVTPYALGFQGRIKTLITEIFNDALKNHPEITSDIKNTDGTKNVFWGLDWFRFMLRCRTMLGCMSGASIHDANGKLRNQVARYMQKNKHCTYEDVKKDILDAHGNAVSYVTIGPRHFEAAMTRTCQVLMEGSYSGILKPGIHYIEIKQDFSNLNEVITLIKDKSYCEKMAERAYKDIVESGRYSYERYVKKLYHIFSEELKLSGKACHKMNLQIPGSALLKIYNYMIDKKFMLQGGKK